MADPTPAERYHRDAVPGAPNTPGARQAETDAGRTTGGGDGVRPWTVTPTPAEIDAGTKAFAEEALDSAGRWTDRATPREVATAVLRAVLPGHDTRLRAAVAEDIARALLAHDQRYPRDWIGGSDGATRAAAIARAHTTGGDHERDD